MNQVKAYAERKMDEWEHRKASKSDFVLIFKETV